jgi:hypothetical protein
MPDGNYGAQIVEWDLITNEWREITSFSNRLGSLEKFIRYLFGAGYVENGEDLPKPFPTQ